MTARSWRRSSGVIIEKTEGNPFFMEEMVQVLFDEGALVRNGTVQLTRPLARDEDPTHGAGDPRRTHRSAASGGEGAAANAGRHRHGLSASLVRQVVTRPEARFSRCSRIFQLGEFIYEQPAFGDVEYTFKHALTQEVAYNSVLIERRKLLHERMGAAIEALFADKIHEHLGDLAHHYARSANRQKAVEYLRLAGEQALQRSANAEAINHLTSALEILKALPDTPRTCSAGVGPPDDAWSRFDSHERQRSSRKLERSISERWSWVGTWDKMLNCFRSCLDFDPSISYGESCIRRVSWPSNSRV